VAIVETFIANGSFSSIRTYANHSIIGAVNLGEFDCCSWSVYESDAQKRISKAIVGQDSSRLSVGLTENHRAVVVEVNDQDAAYTADEARELAQSLEVTSDQRWEESADEAVEYIRQMADVVERPEDADEIDDVWREFELTV
jgi:hypothetical protein